MYLEQVEIAFNNRNAKWHLILYLLYLNIFVSKLNDIDMECSSFFTIDNVDKIPMSATNNKNAMSLIYCKHPYQNKPVSFNNCRSAKNAEVMTVPSKP